MLLALLAQCVLVIASTAHHAAMAAAAGPWGQVCSAQAVAVGALEQGASGASRDASPCPVCGAAALLPLPAAASIALAAALPVAVIGQRAELPRRAAAAPCPPARAPPRS